MHLYNSCIAGSNILSETFLLFLSHNYGYMHIEDQKFSLLNFGIIDLTSSPSVSTEKMRHTSYHGWHIVAFPQNMSLDKGVVFTDRIRKTQLQ